MLLAPTDDIMFFANGEHEEHEVFSQQITLITQIIFREISCFYNHQTNQMNQTIHCASRPVHRVHPVTKTKFVLFVLSVGKIYNPVHPVHQMTKKKFVFFVLSVGK